MPRFKDNTIYVEEVDDSKLDDPKTLYSKALDESQKTSALKKEILDDHYTARITMSAYNGAENNAYSSDLTLLDRNIFSEKEHTEARAVTEANLV